MKDGLRRFLFRLGETITADADEEEGHEEGEDYSRESQVRLNVAQRAVSNWSMGSIMVKEKLKDIWSF